MSAAQNLNIKEVVIREVVEEKVFHFKFKIVSFRIDELNHFIDMNFLLTHKGKPVEKQVVSEVLHKIASSIEDYIRIVDVNPAVAVDHCDHWINCRLDIKGIKSGYEIVHMDQHVSGMLERIDRLFSRTPSKVRATRIRTALKGKRPSYVNNSREGQVS
jgi:hypothetical protein